MPPRKPFGCLRTIRGQILLAITVLAVIYFSGQYEFLTYTPDLRAVSRHVVSREPTVAEYLSFINLAHPELGSLELHNSEWNNVMYKRNVLQVTSESQRLHLTTLLPEDLRLTKAVHRQVVKRLPKYASIVSYQPSQRGIVTIGGDTFTSQVLVQLRMLRRQNTALPVEVFFPESNVAELDSHICQKLFPALNAHCIALPRIPGHELSRFSYKAFALLYSKFEDILFLDADNFPIVDPSTFFDEEPYTSTGLVTWPDFWESMVSPEYYAIIGKPVDPLTLHAGSESGQILISKKKHAQTLLLALYYCVFGDKQYFTLFNQGGHGEGDKDTWIHAAKALNLPYYQVREAVGELGGEVMEWYYVGILQSHPGQDWKRQQKDMGATFRQDTPHAETVLVHHSWTKLSPAFMVLQRYERKWERMWGTQAATTRKYGYDLEQELWYEILYVGCAAAKYLPSADDREQCAKLQEIWTAIMRDDGLDDGQIAKEMALATDLERAVVKTSRGKKFRKPGE